jgi:hypothetical protein
MIGTDLMIYHNDDDDDDIFKIKFAYVTDVPAKRSTGIPHLVLLIGSRKTEP